MLKKYRNLWVFGDSYSTPGFCVDPADSFWMKVAQELNVDQVYNYSWPGNSIDSVAHTLISDSEQYNWNTDFFLVGIPPLARLTLVSKDDKNSFHRRVFNLSAQEIDQELILCHHGLENISFHKDPTAIRFEDSTWTEIQACRTIFLLNQWLDSKKANYLILNLSKEFMEDVPATGKFLQNHCYEHPNNILIEDTYYTINLGINKPVDFETYGWAGHHGSAGNEYFFKKSILPKLNTMYQNSYA